jgi:tetratricopeptide (TPR) repeat protein
MSAVQYSFAALVDSHPIVLLKDGKSADALRAATTAVSAARQAAEDDPEAIPNLIKALVVLGDVHREIKENGRAEKRYREAIDLLPKADVPLRQRARVRARMATMLDFGNRESEAIKYYEQAIDDYEAMMPPDENLAAQLRNNLALIHKRLGNHALAEQHYLRGLDILEQKYGHDSEFTATLFNNLGSLYYTAGFPSQAREMLGEALAIRKKLLGTDHPDVAQTHSNLASTCHELGDNPGALEHYEQALDILERHVEFKTASYEAVGRDFISLLESLKEDKRAAAFKKRMERVLLATV